MGGGDPKCEVFSTSLAERDAAEFDFDLIFVEPTSAADASSLTLRT